MHSTEIVVNGVKGNGMTEIINLLAKGVRQPRKPSHGHPHSEILTFNVAGRDVTRVRFSVDDSSSGPDALCWAIARFRFGGNSVEFNKGRIVDIRAKSTLHGFHVNAISVRSQLDTAGEPPCQILHKLKGTSGIPSSNKIGDNQFGIGINSNPSPNIPVPELAFLIGGYILLFRIAELPDFVTLNPARFNSANSVMVKLLTRCSDTFQEAEDCSLGYSSHTAGSADGISFHEGGNYGNLLGER